MKASADVPATHYRLSPETWAEVVEDYMNGATAREVAAKWKTSPGSVYRWARELHPGSKRAGGDARARAHARMVEEEESAGRGLHASGSRALHGLFAPERESEIDAGDPAALMRAATRASGRAMKGRLWAEAKALAGLAESYARLAEKSQGAAGPDSKPGEDAAAVEAREAQALERKRDEVMHMFDEILGGKGGFGIPPLPGQGYVNGEPPSDEELARWRAERDARGSDGKLTRF